MPGTGVYSSVDGASLLFPAGVWPDTGWFPAVRVSGTKQQGAALIPAPAAPPAGLSVLPSGTVFTFPAASDGPSPHCPAISPFSPPPSPPAPHPSSSLRDDPGPSLGSPACPPLVAVLNPPVQTGEGSLQRLPNASAQHPPRGRPHVPSDVPPSPSPHLHGKGRYQACCMHCCVSCCIHRHDPAPGRRKGGPTAGCGEV